MNRRRRRSFFLSKPSTHIYLLSNYLLSRKTEKNSKTSTKFHSFIKKKKKIKKFGHIYYTHIYLLSMNYLLSRKTEKNPKTSTKCPFQHSFLKNKKKNKKNWTYNILHTHLSMRYSVLTYSHKLIHTYIRTYTYVHTYISAEKLQNRKKCFTQRSRKAIGRQLSVFSRIATSM